MFYLRIILTLFILAMLNACTSMQAIEATPEVARLNFKSGEIITVHTQDKTVYEFKLIRITEEGIEGKRQTLPFYEVSKLEKKEVNLSKTVVAGIGGTYLVVTGGVALLFLLSLL